MKNEVLSIDSGHQTKSVKGWCPIWQIRSSYVLLLLCHVLGGLVSGQLEDDDSAFVKYGDIVWFQNRGFDSRWLCGSRGTRSAVNTRDFLGFDSERSLETTYEWIVLSETGNGFTRSSVGFKEDAKEGECLRYGDTIYLQSNHVDFRWMTGVNPTSVNQEVGSQDFIVEPEKIHYYQWIVRSNGGNGKQTNDENEDLGYGRCVEYNSVIYLQNRRMDARWLTGSRGTDNIYVFTRNRYNDATDPDSYAYQWLVKTFAGSPVPADDELLCAAMQAEGKWVQGGYTNGQLTVQFEEGISRTSSTDFSATESWQQSVEVTIRTGFQFSGANIGSSASVSSSLAASMTSSVSSAISKSEVTRLSYAFSSPGQSWQFIYRVNDLCLPDSWDLKTKDLVITNSAAEEPCCLPGFAVDPLQQHGPCLQDSPCTCSAEVCSPALFPRPRDPSLEDPNFSCPCERSQFLCRWRNDCFLRCVLGSCSFSL